MIEKTCRKNCGVLLHISSLPNKYGIGGLGKEAREFADFLACAGQTFWQVLPIGPTSYGDSPYQSPSSFAGNPYFIDLEALCGDGLITEKELKNAEYDSPRVDYGKLYNERFTLLRQAFERFDTRRPEFLDFCERNSSWLYPYAVFSALKSHFNMRPHNEWEAPYRDCNSEEVKSFTLSHTREIEFTQFLQYEFDIQWRAFREYANSLGIKIIGDAPIYVAYDSADFWQNPKMFDTLENGELSSVAGVPPDYFSADGQLWGNPLYNWKYLSERDYDYYVERVRRAFELYDVLRIDHFRGFDEYYAVPAGSVNARVGEWRKGPNKALFDVIKAKLGSLDIIAEDLGLIGDSVREMVKACGFPGMKVLQFGFDGEAKYNPHALCNFRSEYIGYTGTHDNDTAAGWFDSLSGDAKKRVKSRLSKFGSNIPRAMINALYSSRANTVIVPMRDWLGEGSSSRMNTPGTLGANWQYRLSKIPSHKLAAEMLDTAKKYNRNRK